MMDTDKKLQDADTMLVGIVPGVPGSEKYIEVVFASPYDKQYAVD